MSEHSCSILVVDDEPDMIKGLRRILRIDGYHIDAATTAKELLSRDNWSDYSVIILDRKLPDGTADELLPKLKQLAPHAAVIIVTGYADMDGALTALRHEAADYLIKPVNPDALRASLARIAERNATAERLRQSELRFHLLVDGVQDYAIYMLDPAGNVVSWNDGAKRIIGYADNEILGKHFSCFYTPQDLQIGKPVRELTRAMEKGRHEEEGWRVRKDGSQFYANVILTPLWDQQKHLIGYAKVTRDITEKKRAQAKLMQSARLSAIGEAMAGLVHESRNALNRTQSALRMIERRTKDNPELKPFLHGAREAQRHIQHLFERVRQYAAPVRLNPQLCNLVEVIDQTWDCLAPIRGERTARLVHSYGRTSTECDACDVTLSQVFRNLLENALDACLDPVEIEVQYSDAELHGQPAIRVAVRDNGTGLRPEVRAQAFDAFFTTKTQGTGIGLAISKRIVDAHGGTIGVADGKGSGAEFIVTLPIKKQLQMSQSLRIAIAEDESLALQDLQETVVELGHEVVAAVATGQELVDQCRELTPDLVITDIRMPDMDGLLAAKTVSNERPTPVIIVSAYHDSEFVRRAEEEHVLAYLVKPLQDGSLAVSIDIVMRRWREFQALQAQADSLQEALEERKLIERAKGILMKRAGVNEEDAFLRLQKLSRTKNKKMVEIARNLIDADEAFRG